MLFWNKQSLLDAVAEQGMMTYVTAKGMREPHSDPVQELCNGGDLHVACGLAYPDLFAIMSSNTQARQLSPAIAAGWDVVRLRINSASFAVL